MTGCQVAGADPKSELETQRHKEHEEEHPRSLTEMGAGSSNRLNLSGAIHPDVPDSILGVLVPLC